MLNRLLLMLAISSITHLSTAQQPDSSKSQTKKYAKVLSWKKHAVRFNDSYWDDKQEQILKQITPEEFEQVKNFSKWQTKPEQMVLYTGKANLNLEQLTEKLQKLKVYQIASFDNHYAETSSKGKKGEVQGKYVLVKVPYSDNKDWDQEATWDVVYFILPASAVEEISSSNDKPVQVLRWEKLGLFADANYWNVDKTKQVLQQITNEEFEKVKQHHDSRGWPVKMRRYNGKTIEDSTSYKARMNKLKMYQIASFDHYYNGKFIQKNVLLKVPYAENKNWDKEAVWDTVYFIVPAYAISKL